MCVCVGFFLYLIKPVVVFVINCDCKYILSTVRHYLVLISEISVQMLLWILSHFCLFLWLPSIIQILNIFLEKEYLGFHISFDYITPTRKSTLFQFHLLSKRNAFFNTKSLLMFRKKTFSLSHFFINENWSAIIEELLWHCWCPLFFFNWTTN